MLMYFSQLGEKNCRVFVDRFWDTDGGVLNTVCRLIEKDGWEILCLAKVTL